MPLLTPLGVLAGAGGAQGSLNGTPYPFGSSGRGCAPDDSTILVQLSPQDVLATWKPATGVLEIVQPPRGANAMAGGGGKWLADGAGVVYGSLGEIPGAALIGVAPDSTAAYYPNAQSGIGLVIVDPDGTRHDYPTVIAKPAPQVIKAGQVIWQGGAVGRAPLKPALANAAGTQLVTVNGEDWDVYWSQGVGFIAQVDGELSGWILDTREIEFNASAANINGRLRIAWSVTAGEGPRDIVVCEVTREAVTYVTKAQNWASQQPQWTVLQPPAQPVVVPRFTLNHPVILAPFKAEGSGLRDVFELGTYAEGDIVTVPSGRLLLAHDGESDWTIPATLLRRFDCVLWELYRIPGETLAQSADRWRRQSRAYLAQWSGDCGVIPMCYDQQRWSIAQILDGLTYLSEIVNLSPRIKVIAPFAFNRSNGIVKYPELQAALGNLNTEAVRVGRAVLTPIEGPPPPPPPPKPSESYSRAKEYSVTTERGAIKGPGNKYGRVDAADAGKGPFGWYPIHFDRDTPDEDCVFELSKPDSRHQLRHTKVDGILGADATEFSADIPHQFYLKPGSDRGILESPVLIYDPASPLVVGYLTWPEKAVAGPAFVWVKQ